MLLTVEKTGVGLGAVVVGAAAFQRVASHLDYIMKIELATEP